METVLYINQGGCENIRNLKNYINLRKEEKSDNEDSNKCSGHYGWF